MHCEIRGPRDIGQASRRYRTWLELFPAAQLWQTGKNSEALLAFQKVLRHEGHEPGDKKSGTLSICLAEGRVSGRLWKPERSRCACCKSKIDTFCAS